MSNRYATTLRPAGGGLPSGVKWTYVEAPWDGRIYWGPGGLALPSSAYRYGVIETDRALTTDELQHFDIVEVRR